jgi:hypothetical protein
MLQDRFRPTHAAMLNYYATPGALTSVEEAAVFDALPRDIGALCGVIQGVLLHQHWAKAYGVTPAPERLEETHIRPVDEMLRRLQARDPAPITTARVPAERVIGTCRDFTVMLCAILRHQGVPARARCGFGAYFTAGRFEDHWVCEYWNAAQERWVLVDAQIDALQSGVIKPDFDLLDVPRDRFIIAGDAWLRCRAKKADPSLFGIFDMHGLWFIAGNVLRDFAGLNKVEMLPWDSWGVMPGPEDAQTALQLSFFDRLATLTLAGDDSFAERRRLYDAEARLRVPEQVFNAIRGGLETALPEQAA